MTPLMDERLFPLDDVPEVPLVRRRGLLSDARFVNDYPPDWHRCTACDGTGYSPEMFGVADHCAACSGMGSLKAQARLLAGFRCERCRHPYVPKADAQRHGLLEPSWRAGGWSPCDERCAHDVTGAQYTPNKDGSYQPLVQWRVLTVHHLTGDKADCRWWNLAALCQRCHLEIQAKVVMERIYVHEHSDWFKPHAAGYYAWAYLGEELTRGQAIARLDELLALELTPA